jgi:Tfp pilus assembly protein PilV
MIRNHSLHSRGGFSLLETVISTLLVGLILVSSLKSVGAILRQREKVADRQQAVWLADQLLTEILETAYEDPDGAAVFGPEETGGRALFDDVDDFHKWQSSPPQTRDGRPLTELPGWVRRVAVSYVVPVNPTHISDTDAGIKRITVTVSRDGDELSKVVSLRSRAWSSE